VIRLGIVFDAINFPWRTSLRTCCTEHLKYAAASVIVTSGLLLTIRSATATCSSDGSVFLRLRLTVDWPAGSSGRILAASCPGVVCGGGCSGFAVASAGLEFPRA
jgi:hypothetical protein